MCRIYSGLFCSSLFIQNNNYRCECAFVPAGFKSWRLTWTLWESYRRKHKESTAEKTPFNRFTSVRATTGSPRSRRPQRLRKYIKHRATCICCISVSFSSLEHHAGRNILHTGDEAKYCSTVWGSCSSVVHRVCIHCSNTVSVNANKSWVCDSWVFSVFQ